MLNACLHGEQFGFKVRFPMICKKERFVCLNCFDDPGLVRFIKRNAISTECSFCASVSTVPIAAPIDDVSEYFIECLFTEYRLASEVLGWDGSEGGWIGDYWDSG